MTKEIEFACMLVAQGVETVDVTTLSSWRSEMQIVGHWMEFQSAEGVRFKIQKPNREDLPEIELGVVHWFRLEEAVT